MAVTLALEALFLLVRYGPQRATRSLFLLSFYAVAAAVLRFNSPNSGSPFTHTLLAASVLIPVALFVRRELAATVGNSRRIWILIRQLTARTDWPESFALYRDDPLVRSLRHALGDDAAPLLPLLAHADVRVQVAALAALEAFPTWRKGQAEAVLGARILDQPAVRAAAVLALADVRKDRHLQALLTFLRDPDEEVRRAAATAVLWDAGNRWSVVRGQIRWALAAAYAERDGTLPCSGSLPPEAVADLVAWATEAGAIGKRTTQTLIRHCKKAIVEDGSPAAISRVASLVENPKVPPALRVELAHRLQSAGSFPPGVAARLLGPAADHVAPAGRRGGPEPLPGSPRRRSPPRSRPPAEPRDRPGRGADDSEVPRHRHGTAGRGPEAGRELPGGGRGRPQRPPLGLRAAGESMAETPPDAAIPVSDAAFF